MAQALDSTAVRKIPAEPTGAAKIFQFHRRANILHSVFTLKSRIQDMAQTLDFTAVRKILAEPTGFMQGCIY